MASFHCLVLVVLISRLSVVRVQEVNEEVVALDSELTSLLSEETIASFTQNDIKCFNWYWKEKTDYDLDEREHWFCPENGCNMTAAKDRFCCVRYGVLRRLENDLEPGSNSTCMRDGAKQKVIRSFNEIVQKYEEECRPKYTRDQCYEAAKDYSIDITHWKLTPNQTIDRSSPPQDLSTHSTVHNESLEEVLTTQPVTNMTAAAITTTTKRPPKTGSLTFWIILIVVLLLAVLLAVVGVIVNRRHHKEKERSDSGNDSIHTLAQLRDKDSVDDKHVIVGGKVGPWEDDKASTTPSSSDDEPKVTAIESKRSRIG